jgi:hypothetical protein
MSDVEIVAVTLNYFIFSPIRAPKAYVISENLGAVFSFDWMVHSMRGRHDVENTSNQVHTVYSAEVPDVAVLTADRIPSTPCGVVTVAQAQTHGPFPIIKYHAVVGPQPKPALHPFFSHLLPRHRRLPGP